MVSDDMIMRPPRETAAGPDLSVVAPLYNESQNVAPLVEWILQALAGHSGQFEVILVDDGSRDDTWSQVVAASVQDTRIHGLRLGRNVGQTAAMMAGFDCARGRVVVSLDGGPTERPARHPGVGRQAGRGVTIWSAGGGSGGRTSSCCGRCRRGWRTGSSVG
jgi:hypothetical protein